MISTAQLRRRVKCYALTDTGVGTSWTGPRYLFAGTVWGYIDTSRGSQPLTGIVAGQVIDAMLFVRNTAPVTQDGVVSLDGTYYTVLAVLPQDTQERYQCPLRHVEREKIATDDAPVAVVTLTPPTITVPRGTPDHLGATAIVLSDAYGFPLTGRILSLAKTATGSTVTAALRGGTLIDLHNVPNAPASGDVFTLTAEGQSATLAVTVS